MHIFLITALFRIGEYDGSQYCKRYLYELVAVFVLFFFLLLSDLVQKFRSSTSPTLHEMDKRYLIWICIVILWLFTWKHVAGCCCRCIFFFQCFDFEITFLFGFISTIFFSKHFSLAFTSKMCAYLGISNWNGRRLLCVVQAATAVLMEGMCSWPSVCVCIGLWAYKHH